MAIVKMKGVTIAGQIDDFDRIAEKYVYNRDIHLENAMMVLANRENLTPFEESDDEYAAAAKEAKSVLELVNYKVDDEIIAPESTRLSDIKNIVGRVNATVENEKKRHDELTAQIKSNEEIIETMELMEPIKADLSKLTGFKYIDCKFGHMPKTSFRMLITYLDKLEAFFIKTAEKNETVWGFYFVPLLKKRKAEEVFHSLYYETTDIPSGYKGTPSEIKQRLISENTRLKAELEENSAKSREILSPMSEELCGVYNLAKKRCQLLEIKKNAVHGDVFFYIVGWMSKKDAVDLEKEINASDDTVMFYKEDTRNVKYATPPTKLKNNPVFKPFEMFVKMYGLPSYNEIDPTPILAVTYILFFGIMFGDLGQSFILALAGFIIYKVKKIDLAGIVGWVGLSGMVFGIIYGSFFGNEEIIPEILHTTPIKPMEQAIMMLAATVGVGVVIIIFGLILNIINSVKGRRYGEALFGHNGLAGLVFYVSLLLFAGNMFLKWGIPNSLFIILIILALAVMYMAEPLSKLIEGEKHWLPDGPMYFVENFFEMFEVVLSFFTNTISFLRIGAFAIVHVGMMMVVAILTPAGINAGSIIVMVLGNAIVMILEGLIVGIQVLRLEYYEMFSRYFTGRGKEFISLRDK